MLARLVMMRVRAQGAEKHSTSCSPGAGTPPDCGPGGGNSNCQIPEAWWALGGAWISR